MQQLALAILEHTTASGRHFDLLIEDPMARPRGRPRLFAARLALAPRDWASAGRLTATALPPHRIIYLRHQGPISGGRGRVRRVDQGRVLAPRWTATLIELDLTTTGFTGRLTLRRCSPTCWIAVAEPAISSSGASAAADARPWPR